MSSCSGSRAVIREIMELELWKQQWQRKLETISSSYSRKRKPQTRHSAWKDLPEQPSLISSASTPSHSDSHILPNSRCQSNIPVIAYENSVVPRNGNQMLGVVPSFAGFFAKFTVEIYSYTPKSPSVRRRSSFSLHYLINPALFFQATFLV